MAKRELINIYLRGIRKNAGKDRNEQKDKGFLQQLIPLFSLLISLCSIYIAYYSLRFTATEKGADTEAKMVAQLEQSNDWNDFVVSVQNVSNTQVGVNSAYILMYEIENNNAVSYKGILKKKLISFTRLEPFAKQYDTLKKVVGPDQLQEMSEEQLHNKIFELRIYFSRLFDGKIYGIRSFYTTEGDPGVKYNILYNEIEITRVLGIYGQMIRDFPEYQAAKDYDIIKMAAIEKLKSDKFLKDSLLIQKELDYYPPLDQPYLSPNTQYSIDLKNK